MVLTRHFTAILFAAAACAAFARGNLRDAADFFSGGAKNGAGAKSVLEKGYAPPEKIVDKKPAGADDADLLLGLLASEVSQERANTNAAARAAKPVAKPVVVEKVVTNKVEVVKVKEVARPVTNVVEKVVERVVEKPVEVVKTVEKPVTNTVEKVVVRHVTNVVEKVVEKPVVVERQVTNTVEKVVYDRSVEMRLAKDKAELEKRGGALAERSAELEKRNAELQKQLDEERAARGRLEQAAAKKGAAKAGKTTKTGRPARITSKTTYYDRKKGVALFEGGVYVDDENYQLHADKAFVFTTGTNDVRRIVAVGHVAMTNEMRRAYGGKVSYYRQDGMVVLYSGEGVNAEIRDESKAEDQTVRGSKIKFWIGREQVEVLDAAITAPTDGAGLNALPK